MTPLAPLHALPHCPLLPPIITTRSPYHHPHCPVADCCSTSPTLASPPPATLLLTLLTMQECQVPRAAR